MDQGVLIGQGARAQAVGSAVLVAKNVEARRNAGQVTSGTIYVYVYMALW